MKIVLIGAGGTLGKHVAEILRLDGHEVIGVGRKSGQFQLDIEAPSSIESLYRKIGSFDAVVSAAGEVAFAPFPKLSLEQWNQSLASKLLGQIQLVQKALPYIQEGGSFTLVSGILGDEAIQAGSAAATVNGALEAFVKTAAFELPRGLRINAVSPNLLKDSVGTYGPFFPGFLPVDGAAVAQAFRKSVLGIMTGKVFKVH